MNSKKRSKSKSKNRLKNKSKNRLKNKSKNRLKNKSKNRLKNKSKNRLKGQFENNIYFKTFSIDPIRVEILPGSVNGIKQRISNLIEGGKKGIYEVTFTFMRNGDEVPKKSEISIEPRLIGNSHFIISKIPLEDRKFTIKTTYKIVTFECIENKYGNLGLITCNVDADNAINAEQIAYNLLSPELSLWSCQLDTPLKICRTYVLEKATGNFCMDLIVNYPDVPLEIVFKSRYPSEEFRKYLSIYREALNVGLLNIGASIFEFFCYFKIIEGIYSLRKRLGKEAKNIEEKFHRSIEKFPENEEDLRIFLNPLFLIKYDLEKKRSRSLLSI